jgi:DNA gyrase subunit A
MSAEEKIISIPLHEEVQSSFLDYAMSVIVSRALPDVRDGLKPVHRRILYAMQDLGMDPQKPHKKSARLVGEVLGKYHPHGDQAVYDAMVRMAQLFATRYPLVDGHGNFGSMDGDAAAAMRYTETRLSSLAQEMLRDLDKETVDFRLNFDETLEEPVVLPAHFPNLLVNGSSGIAVGMATNIPPHNLAEVIAALSYLIRNPEASVKELAKIVQGPDFPTGGIILGLKGIHDAYLTGRGSITIRGKTVLEKMDNGKERLLINEIPYQQNKARLMEKIDELVREKKLEGIAELRDESDRSGVRIVLELKKGFQGQIILNQLYKYTPLQQNFGVIMLALVEGRPRILNLKEMLHYYLEHQKAIVIRRSSYLLRQAKERAHIVEGLRIALDHLDRVIALIRGSADAPEAREGLIREFGLSEKQAQAILDMRLQRLTALERGKLEEEYRSLMEEIAYLEALLASEELIMGEIDRELLEIKKKYGDKRLTKIVSKEEEINLEDLIVEEQVIVTLTHQGYIKRLPLDTYRSQHRGGRGIMGHSTRAKDFVKQLFISSTKDRLLCFSDKGKVYMLRVYEIPEAGRQAKGTAIINLLFLEKNESITAVFPLVEYEPEDYLIMATKKGFVKKTMLQRFTTIRSNGLIAMALGSDDKLISVKHMSPENSQAGEAFVLLATAGGLLIRFPAGQLRPLGRTARGVKGISLATGDHVVAMNLIYGETEKLLFVTEEGYGKRTLTGDFRPQNRAGKGLKTLKSDERTGNLISFEPVKEEDEFVIITARGVIIRGKVSQVSTLGRYALGVKMIRLDSGDKAVNTAIISSEEPV